MDACIRLNVPLVVFHHDPPPVDWVLALRRACVPVWMQVSSLALAAAAIDLGVDGLVAQGREAGGRARGTTPLPTLLHEIRRLWPAKLLLGAGGSKSMEPRSRLPWPPVPTGCGSARRSSLPLRRTPIRNISDDWLNGLVRPYAQTHLDPNGPGSDTDCSPHPPHVPHTNLAHPARR